MAARKGRILVVENDPRERTTLAGILTDYGYAIETAADGFKALPKLKDFAPELIVSDLHMPGLDGLGLLEKSREHDPDVSFILTTGDSGVQTAVAAMRQGAADYLTKPINLDHLLAVIERELERGRLRVEASRLRVQLSEQRGINAIIGSSSAVMQPICNTVQMVAPSRASVLITGESGTGKELFAGAIHDSSPRRLGPFIKLHCAALSESLLESELFGHERGAYTGALTRREGRFEQADGGTLFLDEIGETSPSVQVKLLRFLQEHEFERVGGNETVKVDVRVIAATNRDLSKEVREGRFREDLYYRLNVVAIQTPPLRAMRSEIPTIAMHFLLRFANENQKSVTGFTDAGLASLAGYAWPGNVRELENVIERSVLCCQGTRIDADDLALPAPTSALASDGAPKIPGATMAEIERFALLRTLEDVGGSTSRAATILGMSPRKIQYKLQQYGSARLP